MEKEQIKKDVKTILNEFSRQEQGNRITAFNMQGLINTIMSVIDNGIKVVERETEI